MKRRLMLAAMSLILTVTLSVTSMNTVAEASPKMSPTEENLEITINSFLESDGAVAEELTDEMLKTFLETPLDFLRVIDTYPLDRNHCRCHSFFPCCSIGILPFIFSCLRCIKRRSQFIAALRFIEERRSEPVVDLYHIVSVNGHMERFGVRRIVADLGKFLRCKVGVQLIEWRIPPTVRRNIHAEVMTKHLVQSPLIFIFEAVPGYDFYIVGAAEKVEVDNHISTRWPMAAVEYMGYSCGACP